MSLFSHIILSLFLGSLLFLANFSHQLPDSQSQAILTIQKLLNYPPNVQSEDRLVPTPDYCSFEPTKFMTIGCYEDNVTQLHFHGFDNGLVPPLPKDFSIVSLFDAVSSLPTLKVLTLVSLGLWGPLPTHIANCSSLEIINLSSNFLVGPIPVELLGLRNLQTLVLDHNLLTGQLPDIIIPPALTVLSLKSNALNGSLPAALSAFKNLRILQLSENNLTGQVPDLRNLANLQVLDLGDNSLGPKFPTIHTKVVTLALRRNRFRFGMIENVTSYRHLQKLDVSSNEIVGPFDPSFLSLPSIGYLDISGNRFTGRLQDNKSCGADLKFVDLSSNFLTGKLPICLLLGKSKKVIRYRWNCLSNRGYERQHPRAFCRNEALAVNVAPRDVQKNASPSKSVIAMGMVGGLSLVGLALLVSGLVFKRYKFKKPQTRLILEKATFKYTPKQFPDAREICQMVKIGPLGLPPYRKFPLEEIKEITANFDRSMLIGEGSLGPIYRGKLSNDTVVAIRSLKMRKRRGIHTYTHHIELLAKLRHSHLVSAIGHCFECHPDDSTVNRIHLIFEFIPNGTLRDCLADQNFGWSQRMTAATGVAKGIQFLQTGIMPGLYSNNIKITDILVDHDLQVKASSYNLPLLTENRDMVDCSNHPSGSKEKLKAVAKQDESNEDVYDFGVILLEAITGRAITYENEVQVAKDLFGVALKADRVARRNIVDPIVSKGCSDNSLRTVMELCIRCLSSEPDERPSIEDVLWNLQFAAQVQDSWQGGSPSLSNQGTPTFIFKTKITPMVDETRPCL